MKTLLIRSLTGSIYVLFIAASLFAGSLTYYLLFLGLLTLGTLEFLKMTDLKITIIDKLAHILITVFIFTASFLDASQLLPFHAFLMIGVLSLIVLSAKLVRKPINIIELSGIQFYLFFYLALPFALSNYLVFLPTVKHQYSFEILFSIFALLWVNDSGAYLSGSLLGRTPLFKRISPKKTWEGFIGGFIISLAASALIAKYNTSLSLNQWLIFGAIVSVFGTIGDLVESLLKRNANVKDSGKIFPGHGGVLDRIDSFLMAATAVYVYLNIINII